MAPSSFTEGKVELLEPFLSLSRGSAGVMQEVSHARGCGGSGEINLCLFFRKKRDIGAVIEDDGWRQSETKSDSTRKKSQQNPEE